MVMCLEKGSMKQTGKGYEIKTAIHIIGSRYSLFLPLKGRTKLALPVSL
jgi:hypothetical protein